MEIDGAAGGRTIGPSGSSSIAPPKPKCAAPDSSATTRQGIKNTISPAGNVGERARRRHPSTRRSIRAVGAGDPVPRQRPQRRSLRSPELQRRPRTAISRKRSRRRRDITIVRPPAAAERACVRLNTSAANIASNCDANHRRHSGGGCAASLRHGRTWRLSCVR